MPGRPQTPPIYTMNDAEGVLKHFVPCEYGEIIRLAEGLTIRFTDAGTPLRLRLHRGVDEGGRYGEEDRLFR